MASTDPDEEEILDLDLSTSTLDPVSGTNIDDKDISGIEEELLLLSSPSPGDSKCEKIALPVPSTSKPRLQSSRHEQDVVELDDDVEILDDEGGVITEEDIDNDLLGEEIESDVLTSFRDGKINIFYNHGAFFLWNAEDVQMLREECRIVGKLTGCLPRAPRQNNQLGLPLQLMPEETKLLVDIDAAVVVESVPVSLKVQKMHQSAFRKVREQNVKIQQQLYRENRIEEVKQRFGDIIAGKKAKKRKLQESESKLDETTGNKTQESNSPTESTNNTEAPPVKDSKKESNDQKDDEDDTDLLTVDDLVTTQTSEKHSLVQIFTENPWKQSFRPCSKWVFPSNEKEMQRYLVFKDLWAKGFFLTSGSKFGGDFLVYPGDPARYHSHYIAVCKNQYDEIPSLDIISLGRLSSNVRKTALLCALDRHRKVIYTSLQWTGIT